MNDKKKKKEYVKPESEIIEFSGEDIITLSGDGLDRLWWGGDDNVEPF